MAFLGLGEGVVVAPKIASGAKNLYFRSHLESAVMLSQPNFWNGEEIDNRL